MLVTVEKVRITGQFKTDPEMDEHITHYSEAFNEKLDKVIGYTDVDLEGRFSKLRY